MSTEQSTGRVDAAGLIGRLDRLPRHAVRYAVTGIVGLGLFVVFFCNFDINVSFIQTCTQIHIGCTPENAAGFETRPVVFYLAGYLVGGLALAPLSDRLGRRTVVVPVVGVGGVGA